MVILHKEVIKHTINKFQVCSLMTNTQMLDVLKNFYKDEVKTDRVHTSANILNNHTSTLHTNPTLKPTTAHKSRGAGTRSSGQLMDPYTFHTGFLTPKFQAHQNNFPRISYV